MNQADLIRTALALRYAMVLVRGQLAPASLHAAAMEADMFGYPPPQTIALTNDLLTEAARFIGGSGAVDEITAWRELIVLYLGDTPAARAASEDDTRKWVRSQLNELAEKRAELRLERAKNLNLEHRLRVAAEMIRDADPGLADHVLSSVEELDSEEREAMARALAGEAVPHG